MLSKIEEEEEEDAAAYQQVCSVYLPLPLEQLRPFLTKPSAKLSAKLSAKIIIIICCEKSTHIAWWCQNVGSKIRQKH